jgi:hypothetical protein
MSGSEWHRVAQSGTVGEQVNFPAQTQPPRAPNNCEVSTGLAVWEMETLLGVTLTHNDPTGSRVETSGKVAQSGRQAVSSPEWK